MSRTDEERLASALEAELDSLLARTPAEADKPDPDKVLVTSSIPIGRVSRKLGITSDRHLWTVLSRLRKAGVFPPRKSEPGRVVSELFDAAEFLDQHSEHPTIRQLVTLESSETEDIAALQEAFAPEPTPLFIDDNGVSLWQGDSEIS